MRHRISGLATLVATLSLVLAPYAQAAERSVGEADPAKTYIEVVTIDPMTGLPMSGGGGGGGGGAVTLSNGADVTQGAVGDAAWSGTGNGTNNAILKAIRNLLAGTLTINLPSGASTSANQTTGNGYLATLAGAVSSAKVQVDCITGCGGGGTQYAEDSAHVSGDLGTLMLGVRRDTPSTLASADGDRTAAIFAPNGALWTQFTNTSLAVTGTFWQATQPISAAALPLPGGAATSAKQDTAQASFAAMVAALEAIQDQSESLDPVTTVAAGVTSTSTAATITTGGTWQTAIAASSSRKGCFIHNPSDASEIIRVFVGATGTASDGASLTVQAGGTFSCANGAGYVAQDNIAVKAATTSKPFAVIVQ